MAAKKTTPAKKKATPVKKKAVQPKSKLVPIGKIKADPKGGKVKAAPKAKAPKQTAAQKKAADAAAKKKAADAAAKKKTADAAAKKKAADAAAKKKAADEKAAYNKLTPAQKKAADEKAAYNKLTPLGKLEADNKTAIGKENTAYANSKEKLNSDRWSTANIDDLAKEYGFDYSKEYADSQAAAEGRAKLDGIASGERENKSANESTLRQIEQGVVNANNSLDHSFFQQMMAQGQAASDSGMNAGIQGDQNLRLGMNKQAQLASVYSQANEGKMSESSRYNNQLMSFSDQKKTAAVEQLARASSIYQDGREKGFGNLLAQRESSKGYADTAYNQSQDRINQINIGTDRSVNRVNSESEITGTYNGKKTAAQVQRDTENALNQKQFDYTVKSGDRAFGLDQKQFDYSVKSGDRDYKLNVDQFGYAKKSGDRDYAYKVKDGDRNFGLEQSKFNFAKSQASSSTSTSSTKSTKSTKTTKKTPGNVKPTNDKVIDFKNAKKSSAQTAKEKYYAKQKKAAAKMNPVVRKVKIPAMTPANDKSLTAWQKMKLF